MRRSLVSWVGWTLLACSASACGDPLAEASACIDVRARARAGGWDANAPRANGLGPGGWDGNGATLHGIGWSENAVTLACIALRPGGWDANGATTGEEATLDANVVGTTIEVVTESGMRVGESLEGATIDAHVDGHAVTLTFGDVDASDPARVRHQLLLGASNLCGEGEWGYFARGFFGSDGHFASDGATFACHTGVIAKCIDWGYGTEDAGAETHRACVRMGIADYCGDGTAHTLEGTPIRIVDDARAESETGTFEAGWGEDGAVCVHATRYTLLDETNVPYRPPCWASLPSCEDWNEATGHGARLANRSLGRVGRVCH